MLTSHGHLKQLGFFFGFFLTTETKYMDKNLQNKYKENTTEVYFSLMLCQYICLTTETMSNVLC